MFLRRNDDGAGPTRRESLNDPYGFTTVCILLLLRKPYGYTKAEVFRQNQTDLKRPLRHLNLDKSAVAGI